MYISETNKALVKRTSSLLSLTLGLFSFFYLSSFYFKNIENHFDKLISKEVKNAVYELNLETDIQNYINEAVTDITIENRSKLYSIIQPSIDSIVDSYIEKTEPEMKFYVKQSFEKNSQRWINGGL
jgi:hypothetical protein